MISPTCQAKAAGSTPYQSTKAGPCQAPPSIVELPRLRTSESVREVENRDGAVLLDLQQGICVSLTPIAIKIWHMLTLNYPPQQIADRLATDFPDVPRKQIEYDLAEFVADLEQKRLLVTTQLEARPGLLKRLVMRAQRRPKITEAATAAKVTPPTLLFWKSLGGLLLFDMLRLGSNFARIYQLVRLWPVAPRTSPDVVDRVCDAMNYACVWYPKRVRCLQRSAITTCLFRSCGIPAEMVMGAQKLPFKAHAWTEVNGRAVNERTDVQAIYLVWDRC